MVGTASATNYDLTLSNEESNGHIYVQADYNSATGILTFTDKSSTLLTTQTLTSDSGILSIAMADEIAVKYITGTKDGVTNVLYSQDTAHPVTVDKQHDWKYNKGSQGFAEFGNFDTTIGSNSQNEYSKVVVYFDVPGPNLGVNEAGHTLALHYRLGIMEGGISKVSGTFKVTDGPKPPTQVPEFPTIALPVATILGLMFIVGRRKQE
jgi:hypothetical protein